MTVSVVRAFFHSGGLKAGTPFEIASTPVIAAPPEANACSSRNTLTVPVAVQRRLWVGRGARVEAAAEELPATPRRRS